MHMSSKTEAIQSTWSEDLLRAATGVMHLVVGNIKIDDILGKHFPTAIEHAMSVFSDSLSDKMLVCACLGALSIKGEVLKNADAVCQAIVKLSKLKGLHDAIFTTLEQVMQACSHVLFHT